MKAHSRILYVLALLLAPHFVSAFQDEPPAKKLPDQYAEVVLNVEGMT